MFHEVQIVFWGDLFLYERLECVAHHDGRPLRLDDSEVALHDEFEIAEV